MISVLFSCVHESAWLGFGLGFGFGLGLGSGLGRERLLLDGQLHPVEVLDVYALEVLLVRRAHHQLQGVRVGVGVRVGLE